LQGAADEVAILVASLFAPRHCETLYCIQGGKEGHVILSPSLPVILTLNEVKGKNLIPLRVNSAMNRIALMTGSVKVKNLVPLRAVPGVAIPWVCSPFGLE